MAEPKWPVTVLVALWGRTDGLAGLAESLRALGPPYRFHDELMHGALRDRQENAITWHLIHVLEKLEKGVE